MTTSATTLASLRRGDLTSARELNLSRCGLTVFPTEIFGLAKTLEVLDLSGNDLTALPHDLGRLVELKVLFCSGNRFDRLPEALGDCPALGQLGFRRAGVREVPGEALPSQLRWLTLTDNALRTLPDALGQRPALQKLMLSGNQLSALPESVADLDRLELIRLGANTFETLPPWLLQLPSLAWLAWAGNPLDQSLEGRTPFIDWEALTLGALLGEGASGRIYQASLPHASGVKAVAVKLFKDAMTSDGFPEREIAAALAAGDHPRLAGTLGRLRGHPEQALGLVMPLLPSHWRTLAAPPSLQSCSRDVYDPEFRLDWAMGLRILQAVGEAVAHLHTKSLLHGDIYAHNTLWDGLTGQAVLTDFGAASFWPSDLRPTSLQKVEVLAWGRLLAEVADRSDGSPSSHAMLTLIEACTSSDVSARPLMSEALSALGALM